MLNRTNSMCLLLIIPIPQNNIQYNQLNNIIESYAEKDP